VSEDNHRAQVTWLHLVHVWVRVADKDKRAWGEVVVAYGIRVLLLELADRGVVAGADAIMDGSEVGRALLELAGVCGNEIFR